MKTEDTHTLSYSRAWSRPDGVDDDTLIATTLDRPTFEDLAKLCLMFSDERVWAVLGKLSSDPAARPDTLAESRRMLENIRRGFRRADRQTA